MTLPTLSEQLDALVAGQRFWYWLCPGADQPLAITTFADDPGMQGLRDAVADRPLPDQADIAFGFGTAGGDGALSFGSQKASQDRLGALADWARGHVAEHPGLCRLRNARMVQLDVDGVFTDRIDDPGLWRGFPRKIWPGTLAESAEALEETWSSTGTGLFWMTEFGPDGTPYLLVGAEDDDGGEAMAKRVQTLRRRCVLGAPAISGRIMKMDNGTLFFVTIQEDSWVKRWRAVTGPLARRADLPGFAHLARARVVLSTARDLEVIEDRAGDDVSALVTLSRDLVRLRNGALLYFAHTPGTPLQTFESKGELKSSVKPAKGLVIGSVAWRDGNLEFHAPVDAPNMLAELAELVHSHAEDWPVLGVIRFSTIHARDGVHADRSIWRAEED